MNKKLIYSLGLLLSFITMVSFQNCGSTQFSNSEKVLSAGVESQSPQASAAPINEVVIGESALYGKVVWTEQQKIFDRNGQHRTRLDVDLSTGLMNIERTVGTYSSTTTESKASCTISDPRLADIDNLLKSSRVCRANIESKAEQVNCLAVGESDIQLVNSSRNETLELRPNICNSGVFLCEGLDQHLRDLLKDLVLNPPASCQAN